MNEVVRTGNGLVDVISDTFTRTTTTLGLSATDNQAPTSVKSSGWRRALRHSAAAVWASGGTVTKINAAIAGDFEANGAMSSAELATTGRDFRKHHGKLDAPILQEDRGGANRARRCPRRRCGPHHVSCDPLTLNIKMTLTGDQLSLMATMLRSPGAHGHAHRPRALYPLRSTGRHGIEQA